MISLVICSYDPIFRCHHHGELTFSMIYAYSEDFILTLSHDEVVHGKGSMIGKMPGERKTRSLQISGQPMASCCAHPGKKLLFMGQDFAQFCRVERERRVWSGICCSMMSISSMQELCEGTAEALS